MSSLDALSIETTVLFTSTFVAVLACLIVLCRHRWWHTAHGRNLGWLSIGVLGVLLPVMLRYWHVIHPGRVPDLAQWICSQFLLILPLVFLGMTWLMLRPRLLPWLIRHKLARDHRPRPKQERQSTR